MTTTSEHPSGSASDRWPWVAVALIAAVAAIAVAYFVTMHKEQRSMPLTTVAQVASHQSSPPKVITRTVSSPPKVITRTKTIVREEPVYTSAPAVLISASGSCGGGISVNSQTSCPFAENVVQQYTEQAEQAGGPGSFDVYAYSPVTGQSYTDLCTYTSSDAIVSCSHGSDLIEFAYGNVSEPVSDPAPAAPVSASGSCGGGISVNSQTSCPFAENVLAQYTRQAENAGGPRSFDVSAYSPVTGSSYTDTCDYSDASGIVSCSHGSDLIEFAYGSR